VDKWESNPQPFRHILVGKYNTLNEMIDDLLDFQVKGYIMYENLRVVGILWWPQ